MVASHGRFIGQRGMLCICDCDISITLGLVELEGSGQLKHHD